MEFVLAIKNIVNIHDINYIDYAEIKHQYDELVKFMKGKK